MTARRFFGGAAWVAQVLPAMAAGCLLWAAPAAADRHCFPALDGYFDARHALLDSGADCLSGLPPAIADLRAAEADAALCGCAPLLEFLSDLRAEAEAEAAADCPAASADILAAGARARSIVAACQ